MKIIDLIKRLQDLYATYDDEYKSVMGEPEIVIDTFAKLHKDEGTFRYAGYSPSIDIQKTDCGTYDVLSAFLDSYKKVIEIR
jgi:hypothetical protein